MGLPEILEEFFLKASSLARNVHLLGRASPLRPASGAFTVTPQVLRSPGSSFLMQGALPYLSPYFPRLAQFGHATGAQLFCTKYTGLTTVTSSLSPSLLSY